MSREIYRSVDDTVFVTAYAGPATEDRSDRRRLQLTVGERFPLNTLSIAEAAALWRAIGAWLDDCEFTKEKPMGDPAELSDDDIKETLLLARSIVDSVTNDERFAIGGLGEVAQERVLRMAQLLLLQAQRLEGPDRGR